MSRRLLLVTDGYPPIIGGAGRDTRMLGHELVNRGYEVSVVTLWQPGMAEEEQDGPVRVHRIKGTATYLRRLASDPGRQHHPPMPDPLTLWKLRRIVREWRPDLVQSYGWITYSCSVALLGTRIPLLLTSRDYGNVCAVRTLIRNTGHGQEMCDGPALAKCLACAGRYYGVPKALVSVGGVFTGKALLNQQIVGLHSCSTYVEQVMRRDLMTGWSWRMRSSRKAFPSEAIQCFRSDESIGMVDEGIMNRLPEQPFILFVGALRPIKGLPQLFEAYQHLKHAPPLVLMGTPSPDTPRSMPRGVTMLNSVPHPTVMAAWDRSLFGVAPSSWAEPFGNVVHEAMSRGKPVIGTVPGGMRDMIVDGESGLLVPAGDVDALRTAMQRLVDDPGLRARLGETARAQAERFTARVMVPRYEALYDQILGTAVRGNRPKFSGHSNQLLEDG